MKSFEYLSAASLESTTRLLETDGHSRLLAGGTDLLAEMKSKIAEPQRLVDLKTLPGLNGLHFDERNGLRVGALATLRAIAAMNVVKERYPALFKSISLAASPQLRNRSTIGGNLNQGSRCWYYRGPFHCWLKGGEMCYARNGNNYHHAIFGGGPCFTVHPSDPPVALMALRAEISLLGPRGERKLPVEDYFQKPRPDARRLTNLQTVEIVTEIRIPTPPPDSAGTYLKAMDRQTWAFALVSVAIQITLDSGLIRNSRIVLGGVAPVPWRLADVENLLQGQPLNESTVSRAVAAAVHGAQPLSHNGYKVDLLQGLLTEALTSLR